MDRRAALKKLGVGGAIAAGGSIVLSSTNVAYAASNGTLPTFGWTFVGWSGSKVTVRLDLGATTCVRSNEVASVLPGASKAAAIDPATDPATLTIVIKTTGTGQQGVWKSGDSVPVRWSIDWDCASTQFYDQTFVLP